MGVRKEAKVNACFNAGLEVKDVLAQLMSISVLENGLVLCLLGFSALSRRRGTHCSLIVGTGARCYQGK